tara:strand:- start:940 stop:1383 length:444 start_codon:yes stop_codon:yes gene_type:complete
MDETKTDEPKKKNPLQKLKDGLDDKEEQANAITTLIKIIVLGWSGAILTLNYVSIPGIPQQKIDPTFIASVFTGVLASFNITTTSKKGDGTYKLDKENKDKEGLKGLDNGVPYTIIKVETPIKLVPDKPRIDPISGKEVDPQTGKLT